MKWTLQQKNLAYLLCDRGFDIHEGKLFLEWQLPDSHKRFDFWLPEPRIAIEIVGMSGMSRYGMHLFAVTSESRRQKREWCRKNGAKYVEVHTFNWRQPKFYPLLVKAAAVITSKRLVEAARVYNEYSAEAKANLPKSEFISFDGIKFVPFEKLYAREMKADRVK